MPDSAPFWLCHECGAQMRPITVDSVPHCASCNGEFIEILDPEVNPDPYQELPPPPPSRPNGSSPRPAPPNVPGEGAQSFLSSLFGNLLGAAAGHPHDEGTEQPQDRESQSTPSGSGSRTFQFNMPGGGRGQVVFGSLGGNTGGRMGPFGPTGQTTGGMDFESIFPHGFGPPPRHPQGQPLGPGDPMDGADLLRALMSIVGEEGPLPPGVFFGGPGGRANLGDYATSEQGFNDILERLMQAAGPQGPLPASDVVIEGLPRFKYGADQELDCPVCKDDFDVGDEVIRIPCAHIFHPDCLVPWLKTNGSCPVCRFSLVPEEEARAPRSQPQPETQPPAATGPSPITSILNRLFGQSGANTSNPTSPTEAEPAHSPFGPPSPPSIYHSDFGAVPVSDRPSTPPVTSGGTQTAPAEQPSMSTAIPEDYRARHRERERERQRNQDEGVDDFDLD